MTQMTFRSVYHQTCQTLLDLRGKISEGKVGAFLETSSLPALPEASVGGNSWADRTIEPLEGGATEKMVPEEDPTTDRLLNAVRNLEHLFDCAWEAGFKNEAQTYFYRVTRDLLQAIERDGYIPGRGKEEEEEEANEEDAPETE